jgi:integrase
VLLAGGIGIRTLSAYLGHRDPAITLRVYAHLLPSAEQRVLKAIDDALDAGTSSPASPPGAMQAPGQEGLR